MPDDNFENPLRTKIVNNKKNTNTDIYIQRENHTKFYLDIQLLQIVDQD